MPVIKAVVGVVMQFGSLESWDVVIGVKLALHKMPGRVERGGMGDAGVLEGISIVLPRSRL